MLELEGVDKAGAVIVVDNAGMEGRCGAGEGRPVVLSEGMVDGLVMKVVGVSNGGLRGAAEAMTAGLDDLGDRAGLRTRYVMPGLLGGVLQWKV